MPTGTTSAQPSPGGPAQAQPPYGGMPQSRYGTFPPVPAYPAQPFGAPMTAGYRMPPAPSAYAWPYAPYETLPASSHRNTLVFVISIINTAMAGLGTLSLLMLAMELPLIQSIPAIQDMWTSLYPGNTFAVALVFSAASEVFLLVVGIFGIRNAANLAKAQAIFVLSLALIAVHIVAGVYSFTMLPSMLGPLMSVTAPLSVTGAVVGLIPPVLLTVGAWQMKKQAAAVHSADASLYLN